LTNNIIISCQMTVHSGNIVTALTTVRLENI